MATTKNHEWLVWQLADATFPAGGLAHSAGLEAASKWGELKDEDRLEEFLRQQLTQTAHTGVSLLKSAWLAPSRAAELDRFCQAFLNNHVANRASRAQGKAFLISASAAFGLPVCQQMRDEIRTQRMFGHFPVVFGVVTAALQIDIQQATRLFFYMALRSLISSGIRLSLVGPLEGQSLLYRLETFVHELAHRSPQAIPQGIAQTAPLVEIFQTSQDRLYSRLFQS